MKTVEESCERFAVIDQEVVWYGNINLLAKTKVDDSIMRVLNNEIAEVIVARADHNKKHMGLKSWKNAPDGKIMLAGFVVLEIVAVPLTGVFGLTGETAGLCVAAIRIISFCYLFAGANIAFQGIFQALDSGIESLILSVCRRFLFVIPVAWGFSKLVLNGMFGTEIIWIIFPVTEGLTVLVAMIFMRRIYRQKIQALSIHN